MMNPGPGPGAGTRIALSPVIVLLFYLAYLPLRMTDILESYYLEGPENGRRKTRRLLLSGTALALYPLVRPALLALVTGGR
jgi:hypothetical protein